MNKTIVDKSAKTSDRAVLVIGVAVVLLPLLCFPQYLCGEWLKTQWPGGADNWMDVLWPGARGHASPLWLLVAGATWLGTVVMVRLLVGRGGGRAPSRRDPRVDSLTEYRSGRHVLGSLAILAVAIACLPSELLFVTPAEQATHVGPMILRYVWSVAVAIGWLLGVRARTESARWRRMKIRAVMGTLKPTSYREQASTLPPSLSREAEARPSVTLINEFARSGMTATFRGRRAVVVQGGKKISTLHMRTPSPCRLEDLAIEIDMTADMRSVAEVFARVYGPVEYEGMNQPPQIAE